MAKPIDASWAADVVSDANLNATTYGQGTSFPATWPTNRLFWRTDSNLLYKNIGTSGTPVWTTISAVAQSGDMLYPTSTTIGDYSTPASATASSEASTSGATISFEDQYTTNSGWSQLGSGVTVDSGVADKCQINTVGAADNRVYKSLGLTLSDSTWSLETIVVMTSSSVPSDLILTLASGTADPAVTASAVDVLGISYDDTGSVGFTTYYKDGATAGVYGTKITAGNATYYLRLERTSTTNLKLSVFSDSARTTHVSGSPVNQTIPSTVTTLSYINHGNTSTGGVVRTINCTLDDTRIANSATGQVASTDFANRVYDTSTASYWKSISENNPRIYVDLTSVRDIAGVALNIDTSITTETQIKIQTSTDATNWTDQRYINISDFTNNTWRYFPINRLQADARYVRIYGVNNSKVLAIYEIKVNYTPTTTDWNRKHFHKYLSKSQTDNSLDSN